MNPYLDNNFEQWKFSLISVGRFILSNIKKETYVIVWDLCFLICDVGSNLRKVNTLIKFSSLVSQFKLVRFKVVLRSRGKSWMDHILVINFGEVFFSP